MEELLTGIGTVDTSLFVQVRRDGLQIGEVQGGVPQTSADGDADVKMLMAMP